MMAAILLATSLAMPTGSMPVQPPPTSVPKTAPSQTGVEASAYEGEFYRPEQEPYRMCVAQREGRGNYWGTGSNGRYLGTYQMTAELASGAVWMMAAELRDAYGDKAGRDLRRELHDTHPTKWDRFYWDMAFYTILNWEAEGSGAGHWAGGRFSCWLGMTDHAEGR